ncbi:PLDc N-terminal domain-containing protein [Nanoarchaeota archaeon]
MAIFGTLIGIISLICAIWVIYDVVVKNKGLSQTAKVIWIICAVLFGVITAIVYYFIGKKK